MIPITHYYVFLHILFYKRHWHSIWTYHAVSLRQTAGVVIIFDFSLVELLPHSKEKHILIWLRQNVFKPAYCSKINNFSTIIIWLYSLFETWIVQHNWITFKILILLDRKKKIEQRKKTLFKHLWLVTVLCWVLGFPSSYFMNFWILLVTLTGCSLYCCYICSLFSSCKTNIVGWNQSITTSMQAHESHHRYRGEKQRDLAGSIIWTCSASVWMQQTLIYMIESSTLSFIDSVSFGKIINKTWVFIVIYNWLLE